MFKSGILEVKREIEFEMSPEGPQEIRRLIADLRSDQVSVRRDAKAALIFIGKPAVGPLIDALKDPDDEVRWEAAKALGEIADPRAAAGLVSLLMDHNYTVRWAAAQALISIGSEVLAPLFQELTIHPESSWLRRGALHVFHSLGIQHADLRKITEPVVSALEGFEAEVAVIEAAYLALDELRKNRQGLTAAVL